MAGNSLSFSAVLVSCLCVLSVAAPTSRNSTSGSNSGSQSDLDVVTTTTTDAGDVIDWIRIDDQGDVAEPPPFTPSSAAASSVAVARPAVAAGSSNKGDSSSASNTPVEPASDSLAKSGYDKRDNSGVRRSPASSSTGKQLGIVPISRHRKNFTPVKRAPQYGAQLSKSRSSKGSAPIASPTSGTTKSKLGWLSGRSLGQRLASHLSRRGYSGEHWYVTSNNGGVFRGAKAIFSCFKTFVRQEDFTLLQMAVGRTGLSTGLQTVEAGYQYYPGIKNTPRIFTYFNTNGYSSQGDNVGGYDQMVKGWVQSSANYYPGIPVSNYSTFGGTQQELQLQYLFYNNNWWLWMQSEWAGYYPASLFSANQANASATLAGNADQIFFYGEIAQGGDAMTTTDMGSGKSATLGYKQSGYIRNMQTANTAGQYSAYPAQSVDFYDSDSARYNHSYTTAGNTNWGSYVYLGGAGAGGVTGS